MATKTKIEWCDSTWNPIMGCTPISAGCKNCYAMAMSKRFAGHNKGWPNRPGEVTIFPGRLEQPFRWEKPRRIFVCSTSDLFHDSVSSEYIAVVFCAMAANPRHTFLVLTKRPKRMLDFFGTFREDYFSSFRSPHDPEPEWPIQNVHLGVSVENQETADERITLLLQCPAAVRFVSAEPLLGHIRLPFDLCAHEACGDFSEGKCDHPGCLDRAFNQVIVGAETGPGARPMDLDWARSIRDQCMASDIPFFFKSAGPGIETPVDLAIREFPNV